MPQLGPFDLLGPLGAGGMGEVFRARDTRLNRDVALKLLPAAVAGDADRFARFTREAQLLAALNHPNIGAIHGLEEAPGGPGQPPTRALVLELIEGPTLADRIAEGPIPLDEALVIARQIADAVDYAHEQGIVHRDLKPANIKLRPDGVVKVLDFGLAKALAAPGTSSSAEHELTESPTFTNRETAAGLVLGTAAYMAPEQARGRAVDRRADVWAFGVVLFEMLAGRRPFAGETISDTIAAILKDEPEWTTLPASTPTALRRLIARMLEKDPRRRLRDIGDARFLLDDATSSGATPAPAGAALAARRSPMWSRALPWGALLAVAGLTPAAIALWPKPPAAAPALRFAIELDGEVERRQLPALSPDGMRLLFPRNGELWVRALDELEGRPLRGTAGAQYPFWSPDGREIGYLTSSAIWRVALDGSAPVRVATYRASKGGRTAGGVWRRDGSIVFASSATGSALVTVPASGGEVQPLFERDAATESDFHKPSLLPDGLGILVVVDRPQKGADTVAVVTGTTRKVVMQVPGAFLDAPVFAPPGHLLYHRETSEPGLWAVPFSLDRLETTGTPFLIAADGAFPSIGANGLLAYVRTSLTGLEELTWLDMTTGAVTPASAGSFADISSPRLSPDSTRVAMVVQADQTRQVVVVDLTRQTHVALGQGDRSLSQIAWRDDRTVVWGLDSQTASGRLMARRADASQAAAQILDGINPSIAAGALVIMRREPGLGGGLFHAPWPQTSAVPGPATVLRQTADHEWQPALSPDADLLAYAVGDSGDTQVVLRRYPDGEEQWQVSTDGASLPVWSRDGRTLYFKDPSGQIFAVDVGRTPQITLSAPRHIPRPSSLLARAGYDISRDGKRLLMPRQTTSGDRRAPAVVITQGWR